MASLKTLTFSGKLYPFQQQVVEWSRSTNCGIIGLEMGLGKTVITLAMICERNYRAIVVVLPLQILDQWRQSIMRFTNLNATEVCVFQGPRRKSMDLSRYRVVLTTYDVVRTDMDNPDSTLFQARRRFDCLILDEAHKIRNKKTQSYATCCLLGGDIPAKWLLTGTTIINKFADFFTLCEFLDVPGFSRDTFKSATQAADWRKKYYFRMSKLEANLKLPDKSFHQHYLEFDDKHYQDYITLYVEATVLYQKYLADPTQLNFSVLLVKILRLRQCCNHPDAILDQESYQIEENRHDDQSSAKFNKILDIIHQMPVDDKVLIFSQWSHSLEILSSHLRSEGICFLEYNGSQEIGERNRILTNFRNGTKQVLLITITAGGVGLDLSFANHIIIMDSWWNQALEDQAIDRVYRIGQTKKVEVHRLYMSNSIEAWMEEMKREKYKVDRQFHDNNQIYHTDQHLLTQLLHRYV